MKKCLCLLLTACLLTTLLLTFTLPAAAATDGIYTYEIAGGEAKITDVDDSVSGKVTVPATLGGCAVTAIGLRAFGDCTGLTGVTLPAGVTAIGYQGFYGCTALTAITIPEGVTAIGDSAFWGCAALKSIVIPKTVQSIETSIFAGCTALESITVAAGNEAYHSAGNCLIETATKTLIAGCRNSVIPTDGSIAKIGEWAFGYCPDLTTVAVPAGVTEIGYCAFYGCADLTGITIPKSVTAIGIHPFADCPNLTSVTVEAGNTVYHSAGNCLIETQTKTLVAGCKTSVIPADGSVTAIGNDALSDCTGLETLVIPEGVTAIGAYAFDMCADLKSVTLPDSVTAIGHSAFENCPALTAIVLPEGLTAIEKYTFMRCTALESVAIPKSVTEIGQAAFSKTGLKTVYYGGSEADWKGVAVDAEGNDELRNATFVYNYTPSESSDPSDPSDPSRPTRKMRGDLNGDGVINAMDATRILLSLVGKVKVDPAVADINGDGTVNAMDATLILLHIVGKKLIAQ